MTKLQTFSELTQMDIKTIDAVVFNAERQIEQTTGRKIKLVYQPIFGKVKMKPYTMCQVIGASMGLEGVNRQSKRRSKELVIYRQVCAKLLRGFYPEITLNNIGQLLGVNGHSYDHTTILFCLRRVNGLIDTGDELISTAIAKALTAIAEKEKEIESDEVYY